MPAAIVYSAGGRLTAVERTSSAPSLSAFSRGWTSSGGSSYGSNGNVACGYILGARIRYSRLKLSPSHCLYIQRAKRKGDAKIRRGKLLLWNRTTSGIHQAEMSCLFFLGASLQGMDDRDLCRGPCMRWCACNPATLYFAQAAAVYAAASVLYFIATRFVEAPFTNSMTDEQKRIKTKSARTRTMVFIAATVIGVIVTSVASPFRKK